MGTLVNVLVAAGVVYGFVSIGPHSFSEAYRRAVDCRVVKGRVRVPVMPGTVTEADLAPLPLPVQRFLRQAGVVGRPRVHHFRAIWRGRIRSGPNEPWMAFTAEQDSFPRQCERFFLMKATRGGLPVDVYHAFADGNAGMLVRLLSLFPLVDARGPEMNRAETVTLLNDMCVLAPMELVDPSVRWEHIDSQSARAHYNVGPENVSAVLHFGDEGDLVNFVSEDRLAASRDGKSFVRQPWSTPLWAHRQFGSLRLPSQGEGRWHPPEGAFAYLEIELVDVKHNP